MRKTREPRENRKETPGTGAYRTPARRAISDFFAAHPDRHYTADQICRVFGASSDTSAAKSASSRQRKASSQSAPLPRSGTLSRDEGLPRSTVYRQLARLCAEGVLKRFEETDPVTGAGVHVYQASVEAGGTDCGHHFHLKCTACGRVIHLGCAMSEQLLDHIERAHGFSVNCGNSILYGLCRACAPGRLPCSHPIIVPEETDAHVAPAKDEKET